jgi:serine/threonine-protein kinase
VLDRICARALARDRSDRYSSASAFLADVNKFLYSLETPPSPEDLAKLVARRAPVRRREPDRTAAEGTGPVNKTMPMSERGGSVPNGTAPMPSQGKRRRQETATFATHAAFEEIVANATPLFPIQAIDDPESVLRNSARPAASDEGSAADPAGATAERPAVTGGGWFLRAIALVALVAAGVGIGLMLASGQTDRVNSDAAVIAASRDAGTGPIAVSDASLANVVPDAAPAAKTPDAAAARPEKDAGRVVAKRADAAPAKPKGKGTLKVGARPWADVYVDGKKLGQAPGQWSIPSGKHKVELRYPGPDGERRKSFTVELGADQVANLGIVDFSKP